MRLLPTLLTAAVVVALGGPAHANDAGAAKADKAADPAAGEVADPPAAKPAPPPTGTTLSHEQCIDELRKDGNWRESLKNQLRALVGVPEREEPKGGYASKHRLECTAQMAKDVAFKNKVRATELLPDVRAELRESVRFDDHSRDAKRMLRNKRHVVMAYVALWAITVVFVIMMFLRQRRLNAEIELLRRELERAVEEEK